MTIHRCTSPSTPKECRVRADPPRRLPRRRCWRSLARCRPSSDDSCRRAGATFDSQSIVTSASRTRRWHHAVDQPGPRRRLLVLFRERAPCHFKSPLRRVAVPRAVLEDRLTASPAQVPRRAPTPDSLREPSAVRINETGSATRKLGRPRAPRKRRADKPAGMLDQRLCSPRFLFSKTSTHVSRGYQIPPGRNPSFNW